MRACGIENIPHRFAPEIRGPQLQHKNDSIDLVVSSRYTSPMISLRIFISSVQKELAEERKALRDYVQGDAGFWGTTIRRKVAESVVAGDRAHDGVHDLQLNKTMQRIIVRLTETLASSELLVALGYQRRTRNYETSMKSLLDAGMIEMTLPDTPRSKYQKYWPTKKGRDLLKYLEQSSNE